MGFHNDRSVLKKNLDSLTEKAVAYLSIAAFATVFLLQQMLALPAQSAQPPSVRNLSSLQKTIASENIDNPRPHSKGIPLLSMDMVVEEVPCDDAIDEELEFDGVPAFHHTLSEIAYLGFVKSLLSHLNATSRNMPHIPCFVLYHCWKGDMS